MHANARRSLIAARAIRQGTRIEPDMVAIKRPGYGIKPKYLHLVVGRVARVDIEADAVLTWDMV
jgi:sialic acid synthase SpsE